MVAPSGFDVLLWLSSGRGLLRNCHPRVLEADGGAMRAWFGVLLATTGCDGGEEVPKDDATPTDGDTGTPTDTELPPCTNEVVSSTPADGSVDVAVGTAISFTLAEAYPNALVTVTDPEGTELPGTTTVDDVTVTWSGLPLRPFTTYT